MYYITVKQSPQYTQMTLEEFLSQSFTASTLLTPNISNTRTYECESKIKMKLKMTKDIADRSTSGVRVQTDPKRIVVNCN